MAEHQEWRKLNEFQAKKLIDELRTAVEAFNKSSPLAQIEIRDRGGRAEFLLPFGGPFSVKFFEVEPPMKLNRGTVRYAGKRPGSSWAKLPALPRRRHRPIRPLGAVAGHDLRHRRSAEDGTATRAVRV